MFYGKLKHYATIASIALAFVAAPADAKPKRLAMNVAPHVEQFKPLWDIEPVDINTAFGSFTIDHFACATQGSVLVRTASKWQCLPPGIAGQALQSGGPGANASWLTLTGLGTVTSVGATVPSFMSVGGSPITAAGTLAFSFNSQTANLFLASPDGSSGVPSFRAMVIGDIPNASITSAKISATAGITGSQLSASAAIAGSQLAASAGITGAQLAAGANIAGSQLAAAAGITGAQLASATVANSNLANMASSTLKGNATGSTAAPTDIILSALTDITTPNLTLDLILIWNHTTGTFQKTTAQEISTVIGGGVASVNGGTGAVVLNTGNIPVNATTTPSCGSGKLGELCSQINIGSPVTVTFTNGVATINWAANTQAIGNRVYFSTTGALPTGFTALTNYYVVARTASTIEVSATPGGAHIVAASAGSGTQTAVPGALLATPVGSNTFDVIAMPLQAGDWTCDGTIYYNPAGSTVPTAEAGYIGILSQTIPVPGGAGFPYSGPGAIIFVGQSGTFGTGTANSIGIPVIDITLATAGFVYLDGASTFTAAANTADGSIRCRRAS